MSPASTLNYGMGTKWLELLKQIAPGREARSGPSRPRHNGRHRPVRCNPGPGAVSRVEVSPVNVRDPGEIEHAVAAFARSSDGGLIVTGSRLAVVHRDLIVTLAARHKLPAVYYERFFVTGGGLISYGPDLVDHTGRRPATSIASSRARSLPTCRYRHRPNMSW